MKQLKKDFISARIMVGSKNHNPIAVLKNSVHFARYLRAIFALYGMVNNSCVTIIV